MFKVLYTLLALLLYAATSVGSAKAECQSAGPAGTATCSGNAIYFGRANTISECLGQVADNELVDESDVSCVTYFGHASPPLCVFYDGPVKLECNGTQCDQGTIFTFSCNNTRPNSASTVDENLQSFARNNDAESNQVIEEYVRATRTGARSR